MYSRAVTQRMVEATNRHQGWELQYHSQSTIDGAIAHFETLIDAETGRMKRGLSIEEQVFIRNERKLCALDFRYWCAHYSTIVNWEKNPIHPTLNVAQNIVVDIWAEHEDRAIAIILMHLKARQLGISTVYELADCHRFQFWPNSNVVVASADPKKTVEMGQMIRFCLEQQPWWLLPSDPRDKQEKGMTVEFAAINTRLSIQAGNQFHGVARGATPNVGHLTEVSSWDNAEEDIDASFIRAVHETSNVFVGLESTGKGQAGWFPTTWNIVKEDWPRGRSRIRGEFLPWFVGTDIYPTTADLRARPIPTDWIPSDRTIHHAERARQYVLANPMLLKHLAKGDPAWQMSKAQMWYYEIERDTALRKKDLNKFLEEMPADDCVAGHTRISTPQGLILIAEALRTAEVETGPVIAFMSKGLRDVKCLRTKAGRELVATPEHRVALCDGSWVCLDELSIGARIKLSPPQFAIDPYTARWHTTPAAESSVRVTEDIARLMGFFVGDGNWGADSIDIACDGKDLDTIKEVDRVIERTIGTRPRHQIVRGLCRVRSSSVYWWEIWWNLGLITARWNKKQNRRSGYIKQLTVPECIWRSPKPVVAAFLSGLFESDGHANKSAPQTSLFSKSEQLIREVQLLLLGFGINAAYTVADKVNSQGRRYTGRCLRLNALNTEVFHREIGFVGSRKRSAPHTANRLRGRKPTPILMEDVVASVTECPARAVFDLTVKDAHCFGADGILVHNCEAFQNTGLSVIDQDVVLEYREKVKHPLGVYAIVGPGIHPSLVPPRSQWLTGPKAPPIIQVKVAGVCRSSETYQFVPLKFEGYPGYDPMFKLFLYELPEANQVYGIGVDTSDGIGQDWSVIEGLRIGTPDRPHGQTCEYASPYIKADQLWPMALAIGAFYSVYQAQPNRRVQCRICVECRGNGEIVQHELKKRGWINFHPWKKYDNRKRIPDGKVHKEGVFTNVWFRSMMMDKLLTVIDEQSLDIGSPWFVSEMGSLERDPD